MDPDVEKKADPGRVNEILFPLIPLLNCLI